MKKSELLEAMEVAGMPATGDKARKVLATLKGWGIEFDPEKPFPDKLVAKPWCGGPNYFVSADHESFVMPRTTAEEVVRRWEVVAKHEKEKSKR